MNIKELKEVIKNIPDEVTISITDMEDFACCNWEVGTYHDTTQAYLDIIMPVYIEEYSEERDF